MWGCDRVSARANDRMGINKDNRFWDMRSIMGGVLGVPVIERVREDER